MLPSMKVDGVVCRGATVPNKLINRRADRCCCGVNIIRWYVFWFMWPRVQGSKFRV